LTLLGEGFGLARCPWEVYSLTENLTYA